jgi:hypothetical protein
MADGGWRPAGVPDDHRGGRHLDRVAGVRLGGDIESGVVQVGDRMDLLDDGKLIKVVTCDGLGSFNRIGGTDRCLPGVHSASLSPGEVREGQVLAGAELRRTEDAALPRSPQRPGVPAADRGCYCLR